MKTVDNYGSRQQRPHLQPLACLIALVGALSLFTGSATASGWTETQLPAKQLPGNYAERALLTGVSCPSESLCVAVGALNTVAFSQSPTGGADAWHIVRPQLDEPNPRCVNEGWSEPCRDPRGGLGAVACPTESLCVAVGHEGSVYVSTDPTGGAGAWSISDLNEGPGAAHLTSVSCPSASLCVAVSGGYAGTPGRVFTSTAPASGSWQAAQLEGAPDLRGVSCSTPTLCVAVAKDGRIFASANPTGGASAWPGLGSPTPRDLEGVSCVAVLLCAAGDAGGNILTSTDPLGRGFAESNVDGSVLITGVACPTTTRCVAVDNNADVLTSIDPTGGPSAWTFQNLVPFEAEGTGASTFVGNALFGASCASTSLCALVGAESRIFTSTDPFAAPGPSRGAGAEARKKRARLRPRSILVFAEDFWKGAVTRQRRVKARFRFYSPDVARGFLCKRDSGPWRRCHSPLRYWAPIGRHALRVRAIGPTGLRGPATTLRFVIEHPPHR